MQLFQIAPYFNWLVALVAISLFIRIPKELRILAVYSICLPFFVSYISSVSDLGQNNMHLKHILAHLEMAVYSITYFQLIISKKTKVLIVSIVSLYVVFSILNTVYNETLNLFPSQISLFCTLTFLLYTLLFFHQIYSQNKIKYLEKYPYFWLNSGILFYYLSTMIFSLFYNYLALSESLEFYLYIEKIDSILFMIFKICISITFLLSALQNERGLKFNLFKTNLSEK